MLNNECENIGDWGRLYCGDWIEVMGALPDNSVDSVITDPPAGIFFMGKKWDGDKGGRDKWIAWLTEGMKECLRVLKPGGMALVWCIPRTAHWTATAIEDAGFEIRDKIYHIQGQGFKKGLDISKAIDKITKRVGLFEPFAKHYEKQRKEKGLTHNQICEVGKFYDKHNHGGASSNWGLGANVPTVRQWKILQPLLDLSDGFLPLIESIEVERKIIGKDKSYKAHYGGNEAPVDEFDITAPATPEAQRFAGYGTGLKPSVEEWVLAMKKLDGNFAENALKHGVAGLAIDKARIQLAENDGENARLNADDHKLTSTGHIHFGALPGKSNEFVNKGRWPSNLLLSHHELCREIGVKKVKGSQLDHECSRKESSQVAFTKKGSSQHRQGYTAPDGTETVPAYECAAGCPCGHVWATRELTECPECGCRKTEWVCAVKMLDEQAGELKTGGAQKGSPIVTNHGKSIFLRGSPITTRYSSAINEPKGGLLVSFIAPKVQEPNANSASKATSPASSAAAWTPTGTRMTRARRSSACGTTIRL